MGAREAVMNHYVARFHKTTEYNSLDLYRRKVVYSEVFGRMAELHPKWF